MKNKKLTGYIITYSKKARDIVVEQANTFLSNYGVPSISANLFLIVDELVKNAVKANYKYILIREKMFGRFRGAYTDYTDQQIEKEINDIVRIQESYDYIANEIITSESLSVIVREILNEESKLINIKNKAYAQKREFTDEERKTITGLLLFNETKQKIKQKDLKIILKIETNGNELSLEVTNTAPILSHDLKRIYHIRELFNKYRKEGKASEFFISHLDTSESGFGLGYATIDSIIANWGLDPLKSLTIISSLNTTILLSLPLSIL